MLQSYWIWKELWMTGCFLKGFLVSNVHYLTNKNRHVFQPKEVASINLTVQWKRKEKRNGLE